MGGFGKSFQMGDCIKNADPNLSAGCGPRLGSQVIIWPLVKTNWGTLIYYATGSSQVLCKLTK